MATDDTVSVTALMARTTRMGDVPNFFEILAGVMGFEALALGLKEAIPFDKIMSAMGEHLSKSIEKSAEEMKKNFGQWLNALAECQQETQPEMEALEKEMNKVDLDDLDPEKKPNGSMSKLIISECWMTCVPAQLCTPERCGGEAAMHKMTTECEACPDKAAAACFESADWKTKTGKSSISNINERLC